MDAGVIRGTVALGHHLVERPCDGAAERQFKAFCGCRVQDESEALSWFCALQTPVKSLLIHR
jgi:hypothetical protein